MRNPRGFAGGAGRPVPSSSGPSGPAVITNVSSDGTYMVDQYGSPRMFFVEDVWSLIANGGRWNSGNYQSTFDTYFAQRAAQGYTAAEVSLVASSDPNDNWPGAAGQDWDLIYPFSSTTDPTTTPNPTFWARRDYLFQSAAANGITVVPNFPGVGPSGMATSWTATQWQAYGTFLGNRYKNQQNIIWICGDGILDASMVSGFATWLTAARAAGDRHVISLQCNNEQSSRYGFGSDNAGNDPYSFSVNCQFDWCYSYNVSYQGVLASIANEPSVSDVVQGRIPIAWADGHYLSAGGFGTDGQIERNDIWWALTSGACGAGTGDNDIFGWDSGSAALVTGSWYASEIPAITSTFSSLHGWWKLRPDSSDTLVTSGRGSQRAAISSTQTGEYTASSSPYPDPYVTAAYAADGSLALIYCAVAFTITINTAVMQPGATATWIDPASGAQTPIGGGLVSSYSSSGRGNNSAGHPDWLLVLKA